jgi:hypothetical protein
MTTLKNELMDLSIKKVMMWTDSQTVIGWLRSANKKFSPFVAHRIGEILDATDVNYWR